MTNPRGFLCIFIPASTAPMLSISQLGIADLWYNRSHLRQNVCHISCSVEKLPLRFVGELYPKSLSGNLDHGVLLGLVCVLKNWYEVSLLWGGIGCFHRPREPSCLQTIRISMCVWQVTNILAYTPYHFQQQLYAFNER